MRIAETTMPIKRKIRNASIATLGRVTSSVRRNLGKRVIALHEIADGQRFKEKMQWICEKFEVVSLEELLTNPINTRMQLAITFDDGYASWHEFAAPVLEDLKIPAVFFVSSGFVGLQGAEAERFINTCLRRQQSLVPLTNQQLLDLARHPLFEIGSHTVNHVDLGLVADRSFLGQEIGADRVQLEEWTGKSVRWFAYPFGGISNLSAEARSYLEESTFKAAFTIIPGYVHPASRYMICRDSLNITEPDWLWRCWLNGGYDDLYSFKEYAKRVVGR